jgi:hypothetical protein
MKILSTNVHGLGSRQKRSAQFGLYELEKPNFILIHETMGGGLIIVEKLRKIFKG